MRSATLLLLFFLGTTALDAATPCDTSPKRTPYPSRTAVPRAAFKNRAKPTCAERAISVNPSTPIQWTQFRAYLLATNQLATSLTATTNLDSRNLGTVHLTHTTPVPLTNARVTVFADIDIDRATNGFANEYGEFISLALPPGATPAAIPPDAWEIDEPGFLFGDIFTNVLSGALDGFNATPASTPDDVAFALRFPIGDLAAGESFSVQLRLDTTNIGGLRQTDPASSTSVYLNGFADLAPSPIRPIPSPSSLPLLLLGLGIVAVFRRHILPEPGENR